MTINNTLLKAGLPILLSLIAHLSCHKKNDPQESTPAFSATPLSKTITPGLIDEASGIADSKANPGYLWVEQDSGNPNDIALLSQTGQLFKKINIRSAINRDWEDMALGNGPNTGTSYLYIAETGDNNKAYAQYSIYRFPEPSAAIDTVNTWDELKLPTLMVPMMPKLYWLTIIQRIFISSLKQMRHPGYINFPIHKVPLPSQP